MCSTAIEAKPIQTEESTQWQEFLGMYDEACISIRTSALFFSPEAANTNAGIGRDFLRKFRNVV